MWASIERGTDAISNGPRKEEAARSTPSLFDHSAAFCGVNAPRGARRRSTVGRNAASPTTQIHSTAPISVSRQFRDCWAWGHHHRGLKSSFRYTSGWRPGGETGRRKGLKIYLRPVSPFLRNFLILPVLTRKHTG